MLRFIDMLRRIFNGIIETTTQYPAESAFYPNSFTKKETATFGWLTSFAPCFPIKASNIRIIDEPWQFYETLVSHCKNASRRITLVSLYLGNGEMERKMVNSVMNNEYFKNKHLMLNVLLDYTRGSRSKDNSRTMLQPLLLNNEKNCNVSLYHTPVLRGLLKKLLPNRYNELIGLQHMKLYIFDDTLVISGANLSNDYFANRQDRYFEIKDKNLSDFYSQLVSRVQKFSLKMDKNNNLILNEDWTCSPYEGDKDDFIEKASNLVHDYISETKHAHNAHRNEGFDTWIFPLVQMGQFGINQDSQVTQKILAEAPRGSRFKLATGYFNLTYQYMKTIIESKAFYDILMAHPKANGFLGAKGPAGGIPYAYSIIARQFKEKIQSEYQQDRVKLYEYLKDDWTYHAKGLWYYPPDDDLPCMTMIGSPNFGERSVTKDLESQLVIVTENRLLQEQLHEECNRLFNLGIPAETERKAPIWVNLFVLLFRNYF